jgi:hypothetical protein
MPTERIRCDDDAAEQPKNKLAAKEERKTILTITPHSGPFKDQMVFVYKRGTSGFLGVLESGEEVYVFSNELRPAVKRIK